MTLSRSKIPFSICFYKEILLYVMDDARLGYKLHQFMYGINSPELYKRNLIELICVKDLIVTVIVYSGNYRYLIHIHPNLCMSMIIYNFYDYFRKHIYILTTQITSREQLQATRSPENQEHDHDPIQKLQVHYALSCGIDFSHNFLG